MTDNIVDLLKEIGIHNLPADSKDVDCDRIDKELMNSPVEDLLKQGLILSLSSQSTHVLYHFLIPLCRYFYQKGKESKGVDELEEMIYGKPKTKTVRKGVPKGSGKNPTKVEDNPKSKRLN